MSRTAGFYVTDAELELGKQMVRLLVNVESKMPMVKAKYASVSRLHGDLFLHGFKLVKRQSLKHPEAGWHLFYLKGRVLVRIKTRGASRKHDEKVPEGELPKVKRGSPHLTISLIAGQTRNGGMDIGRGQERGKFHLSGGLVSAWVEGPFYDGLGENKIRSDQWADATHFDFPDIDVDDEGVESLPVG